MNADLTAIIATALSLLALVGWTFVLHCLHKRAQAWYLSLPECPDCGGTGRPEGKRASCPRCDGFGRLKDPAAATQEAQKR